jgi:hypothetical protein
MKIIISKSIRLKLLCLVTFFQVGLGNRQPGVAWAQSEAGNSVLRDSLADWTDPLSRTVVRYFEGQSQFIPGDLIVRSQVDELQDYLRKTRRASPATNPQLRKHVLVDHACLAKAFYGLGGDWLLREAARKLGGYGPLDQLCQSKAGREILTTAIRLSDLEMLLDYLRKHELPPEPVRVSPVETDKKQVARKLSKIYTVEDLLKVLHPDVAS